MSFIKNVLSSNSHWCVNKRISKEVGIEATVLLTFLIDKMSFYEESGGLVNFEGSFYFYATSKNIEDDLSISYKIQKSCIEKLVNCHLIKTKLMGVPAKLYFTLCEFNIELLMKSSFDKKLKQGLTKSKNKKSLNGDSLIKKQDKETIIRNNNNIVNFQNFENSTQSQNDFILDEKKENAPQTGGAVFDKKNWKEGHGDGELHAKLAEYYKNPNSVEYSPEIYRAFKEYWTAIVQNGKGKGKELWRTKDTFLVSGRLSTWSRNNFNNESNNQSNGNSNTNPRHKDNWNAEQTALDALAISKARFAEQRQFE
jgi:hypothetical protein